MFQKMYTFNTRIFGEDILKIYKRIKKDKKRIKPDLTINPLEKIKKAIEKSKKIEIQYVDEKGKRTVRVIKPQSIKNGNVIAYCYLRNSWRAFKIKRIEKIKLI